MSDNKKVVLNLFAAMQDALFLGDPLDRGEFVALMHPGQYLSTSLKEGRNSDDMAIIAEEANAIFDTSTVHVPLAGSVSSIYRDVLEMSALPHSEVSSEVIKEIEALEAWLASSEAAYTLYANRYADAREAYDTEASSQNPNGGRLARLRSAEQQAARAWETFGKRSMFENKYGRLIYLTGPNPASLWGRYRTNLQSHTENAPRRGSYLATFLSPPVSSWTSPGTSWGRFEREVREEDRYNYSKQTSWSGGASGRWGLWKAKGGASGSSNYEYRRSDSSTFHVSFDYLRVRIERPWLNESLWAYMFWTWKKSFGGKFISDGGNLNVPSPVRPVGLMPVLPKYLIVVRNVELSSNFGHEEREYIKKVLSAGASGGWGPFRVSGSYKQSTTEERYESSFDGTTIRIDQPQIIAKTGIILPKSPNPDLSLEWGADAWLPGAAQADELSRISQIRQNDYIQTATEEQLEEQQNELRRSAAEEMERRRYEMHSRSEFMV